MRSYTGSTCRADQPLPLRARAGPAGGGRPGAGAEPGDRAREGPHHLRDVAPRRDERAPPLPPARELLRRRAHAGAHRGRERVEVAGGEPPAGDAVHHQIVLRAVRLAGHAGLAPEERLVEREPAEARQDEDVGGREPGVDALDDAAEEADVREPELTREGLEAGPRRAVADEPEHPSPLVAAHPLEGA